jgi:hypothetical protein
MQSTPTGDLGGDFSRRAARRGLFEAAPPVNEPVPCVFHSVTIPPSRPSAADEETLELVYLV